MTETVVPGLPGVTLHPGDHVCAFYRGRDEREHILRSFLGEGLAAEDKLICVVESVSPGQIGDLLGAPAKPAVESGALEVLTPEQTYLRSGHFKMVAMLDYWREGVETALADPRFSFVRIIAEMPLALTTIADLDEFMCYESAINRFAVQHPQVIVCLYDLERFGGAVLIDVLRTHPVVLLGGAVLDNPYYLEPDHFLASRKRVS